MMMRNLSHAEKKSDIVYMLIKERTGFTIKNSILEIRPRLGFV